MERNRCFGCEWKRRATRLLYDCYANESDGILLAPLPGKQVFAHLATTSTTSHQKHINLISPLAIKTLITPVISILPGKSIRQKYR